MPRNHLDQELVTLLRQCYDDGLTKHKAMKITHISEACVYRYYARWKAFDDANGNNPLLVDLGHLRPELVEELKIQATMRRMSLNNFVMNLLETIVTDYLFNVILEIEDDNPNKDRLRREAQGE